MKQGKITLCWLPPAKTYLPSPAMTILKQTLQEACFNTQTIYFNILLDKVISKYFFYEKKPLDDEIAALGPFFSYIALESNDGNSLIKQELYLRALRPQYANINFDFQKHIRECVKELKSVIVQICNKYEIKESPIVGFSMNLFQWIPAYVIGTIIKRMYPDKLIVAGGIGNPEQAKAYIKNFKYIDIASWGEGEMVMSEIASRLSNGEDLNQLSQCYLRHEDKIIRCTTIRKNYKDLNSLYYYDFSDFFKSYKGKLKDVMLPIEGSRGCHWNRCHFCFLNQGYKYRRKSSYIIKEEILRNIRNYSVYDYTFLDNDVIGRDREKFNDLLDKLIEVRNMFPKFRVMLAEIITRGIDFKTIKKMHIAGFIHVQIGYESPSDSLLHKIDKKNSFASNLFFIKWACEFHINVGGMNVLRGLLEEKLEDIKEGVQNLYFMRFYQLGSKYKHEISSLAINNASRYFSKISKSDLQMQYSDAVKEMLPDDFLPFEDSLSIYQYVRRFQLPAWEYFASIERHYAENTYSYELIKLPKDVIRFREYYNSAPIRVIDFKEEGLAWKILKLADKKIVSKGELFSELDYNVDIVNNELNKLREVGLLYIGKQSEECVSIINTQNIL